MSILAIASALLVAAIGGAILSARAKTTGTGNPGGRYPDLPEACHCTECGYTIENPGVHCPQLGPCPKCGASRLWRQK